MPPTDVDPWSILGAVDACVVVLDDARRHVGDEHVANGDVRRVTWCTPDAARLVELPPEQLVGSSLTQLLARCRELGVSAEQPAGLDRVLVLQDRAGDLARAAFLARAADELAESLNLDRTMTRIVDVAVPHLADGCLVSVLRGRDLRRCGGVAAGESAQHWQEHGLAAAASVRAVARVRATATPELHASLDSIDGLIPSTAAWEPLRSPAPHTAMVVPLRSRGAVLGGMILFGRERAAFGPRDLELAMRFARRAALAIDNAILYSDRSSVAEVLQRSLLPPRLPEVPHVDIAARYRPVIHTVDIGGDFYDVFDVGGGAWMAAVGDVCGKGPAAAAMTGLARHTIRAASMRAAAPSAVLRALNDALHQQADRGLCTVVLARVTPTDRGVNVVVSSGGHPPALVLRRDGEVVEVDVRGTLLGAVTDPALNDRELHLASGDALVLYTDGVIEARIAGRQFGEERLRQVLAASAGLGPDEIAERIVQEAADFVDNVLTDDIAVLVIRAEDPVDG